MDRSQEKTTAPYPPVGADGGQSLSQKPNQSIAEGVTEHKPPERDLEEIMRQISRVNDPAYLPTVSMNDLYEQVYPGRPPVIDGLLYAGTYLFVGAPKVGKSFLMAQLAYHVSMGLSLWGYEVRQGTVLYLALEDNHRRLQERLYRMFGVESTGNLFFAIGAKQLGGGLEEQLKGFVREHTDTRLIIIDTLQKIREAGGEKCSYKVPTYEALKGILSSVYWKPTFVWRILDVRVMNPIQTEVKGIRPIKYGGGNDLAYYTYLKNCRYQVRACFDWNDNRPELIADRNENKHHCIARRMIEKGGRRDIFLGTRECQGYVEPCEFGSGQGAYDDLPELGFGLMYHGITYPDEAYSEETRGCMTARFWYPVMKNGVIHFLPPEECPGQMSMKVFSWEQGNFTGLKEFGEVE